MVYRVRKQLIEEGFAAGLTRKPHTRPSVPRIFDGEKEARLIARPSCPPKGYARWTLRLLEKKSSSSKSSRRRATARSVVS